MQNVENPWGHKPIARFNPKRTDNVRPELVPLIGEAVAWHYVGTGGDDEPYPGQQRWQTDDPRFGHFWAPAEDLEAVAS